MCRRPRWLGRLSSNQNQFREFNSHRVNIVVWTFFLNKEMISGKPRERELATFNEDRRAVEMLNPMRDKS